MHQKRAKYLLPLLIGIVLSMGILEGQTTLSADGPGNTYEIITSVLAPGANPIETPDCGHTVFGRHIREVWDADLGEYVFAFYIHRDNDDDRCINFDRQRNEIKTYGSSPNNLKGVLGETVVYKWKFKLDAGFQPSTSFTHIHQMKAVGGSEASMPQITLTCREGSTDKLELRYAPTTAQFTLADTPLAPFLGEWVQATQTITFGEPGSYNIILEKVSDGTTLFSYSNPSIRMWKTNASFIRPKWGIYRSLNVPSQLRDETVYFNDFSIHETDCPNDFEASGSGALVGTESGVAEYQTNGKLESLQIIAPGADVKYDSKLCIELKPGFEVQSSALFETALDGCN